MAREAREAEVKKRKRNRTIRNGAIAVAVFVIAVVLVTVFTHKDKSNSNASTSTSTPATTVPKNTHQTAPPVTIDPKKTYTADISTTYGDIKVALDAKDAPKGVNNFVHLARQGFYDGLTWHRLVKGFVIQGGDPEGNGNGGPGYTIVTELPKDGYPLGTLAWAKTSDAPAGSAGSQFFITTVNQSPSLQKEGGSYQYGVFGHVQSGMPVVKKIESYAPNTPEGGAPAQPIYIKKVTITET